MNDMDIRSGLSEEERKRLEKIDRIDSNKNRKKIIIAAVTAVLILFFAGGTVFGGIHILSYEGTGTLPEKETDYPEIPADNEDILSSFDSLIKDTMNFNGIKLDVSFSVSLADDTVEIEGDNAENVKAALEHIKSSVISLLSSEYESQRYSGKYGEDFSDMLLRTDLLKENVEIKAFAEEENQNNLKYVFTFDESSFGNPDEKILNDVFCLDEAEKVMTSFSEKTASVAKVGEMKRSYDEFIMTANIDRLKNELINIEQKRVCNIVLPLEFTGEYEDFGELTLSFKLVFTKVFNFTRVQFFFRDDVFYIEKGSSDEFKTKVISDQSPAEIEISFSSSDPSVISVDGSFYKGESVSAEPITVTGTYTYNGITYEDTCLFYVRIPVESVKVKEKEINLKKGETKSAEVTFSPENATVTKLYWFSSDENIASVDENGVITAISSGSADVYCITQDGNYKTTCTVTITE